MKAIVKNILVILACCICFITFSQTTNAANYNSYLEGGDHSKTEAAAVAAVQSHLDANGGNVGNMNDLKHAINDAILDAGGWRGKTSEGTSRWNKLARVKDGKLLIGCGNKSFGYFDLPPPPPPPCYPRRSSYISHWSNNTLQCSLDINGNPNRHCTKPFISHSRSCLYGCGHSCPASARKPAPPSNINIGAVFTGELKFQVHLKNQSCPNKEVRMYKSTNVLNIVTLTGNNGFGCTKNRLGYVCKKNIANTLGSSFWKTKENSTIDINFSVASIFDNMGIRHNIEDIEDISFPYTATINNSKLINFSNLGYIDLVGNENTITYNDPNECIPKPPVCDIWSGKPLVLNATQEEKKCTVVNTRLENGCYTSIIDCPNDTPKVKCPIYSAISLTDEEKEMCTVEKNPFTVSLSNGETQTCYKDELVCKPTVIKECPKYSPPFLSIEKKKKGCRIGSSKYTLGDLVCYQPHITGCIDDTPVCGNSKIESGETCDDGNTINGDGCNSYCSKEPTIVVVSCGNAKIETGETCDDGNLINGDGCNNICQNEPSNNSFCGDNRVGVGETCDDGNTNNGDGCNGSCQIETGSGHCGDDNIGIGETCDDGNINNGDGCNDSCQKEFVFGYCGNGTQEGGETCDDGNTVNGDGCNGSCKTEPIIGVCGNGIHNTGESCDDGNISSGDGCSKECKVEVIKPGICGDNTLNIGETCDDGNTVSGDGCSSTCKDENELPIDSIPTQIAEKICLPTDYDCITNIHKKPSIGTISLQGCDKDGGKYVCFSERRKNLVLTLSEIGNAPKGIGLLEIKGSGPNGNISFTVNNMGYVNHNRPYQISLNNAIFSQPGEYKLKIRGINAFTKTDEYNLSVIVIANNDMTITGVDSSKTEIVANGDDMSTITLKIRDSYGNKIESIDASGNMIPKDYGIFSNPGEIVKVINSIYLDQISYTGKGEEIKNVKFNNSQITFDISSRSPDRKEMFIQINIPTHEQNTSLGLDSGYTQNLLRRTPVINFKAAHSGKFTVAPEVSTTKTYEIILESIGAVSLGIKEVNITQNSFRVPHNYNIHSFNYSPAPGSIKYFDMRLDSENDQSTLDSIVMTSNKNLWIHYDNGARYVLGSSHNGVNRPAISVQGDQKTTLGVKIVGIAQVDGDQSTIESGNFSNYTDVPKALLRQKINQEISIYSSQGDTNKLFENDRVHYVRGSDYTIDNSTNLNNFDTLIVENGNVIIETDITSPLRILVTKDNYNVQLDSSTSGNVYIDPSVVYVHAYIYADGGFISYERGGRDLLVDSVERTGALKNQLVLKGSLFTRNTIGGASESDGSYNLPGGKPTNSFDHAMRYDLNYVRTGEGVSSIVNKSHTDPFVIIYDPQN